MIIGICKETKENEKRVACTPEIVEKLKKMGCEILIEENLGEHLGYTDKQYIEKGAIINKKKEIYENSKIIIKINRIDSLNNINEIDLIKENQIIISMINSNLTSLKEDINKMNNKKITYFATDLIPRISRAQQMDILSSQANLIGYKAVLLASQHINKVFPMMTTSAGNIKPVKILILGAGVAGLQAIATAKRLGALVFAYDVRKEVKEQVESLGAKFINIEIEENIKTKDGYAKELKEENLKIQQNKITELSKDFDIIITTALIPWKKSPILIKKQAFDIMKPGSIIIDLASENGGNVEGSIKNKEILINKIKLLSPINLISDLSFDASNLISKNIFFFLELLINKKEKKIDIDFKDEILNNSCILHEGYIRNEIINNL